MANRSPIIVSASPISDPKVWEHETDVGIHTRAYLSQRHADEYRPVFDEMIRTRENRQILSKDLGIKSSTIYQKAQDALKYLSENGNDPRYAILRKEISMRRKSDRVLLFFKCSIRYIISKGGVVGSTTSTAMETEETTQTWREAVTAWIGTAKSGDIYDSRVELKGLILNEDEKTWLVKMLAGIEGCELDVQGEGYFRICR